MPMAALDGNNIPTADMIESGVRIVLFTLITKQSVCFQKPILNREVTPGKGIAPRRGERKGDSRGWL
jgi:hypothetical protein